jgi:hypothetical protein
MEERGGGMKKSTLLSLCVRVPSRPPSLPPAVSASFFILVFYFYYWPSSINSDYKWRKLSRLVLLV